MDKIKKINISLILCYLIISSYIILGNCLTFNLGNRMPIKVAEVIALIGCSILLIFHGKNILKLSKGNIKLLIWFAIASIPILFFNYALNQKIYGLLYSARIIATIFVAIVIVNIFKKYEISSEKILKYIINNYLIVALVGILQLIFIPDAFDFYEIFYKIGVYFSNPDPHIGRLISTYFDPNFLASCLIIPTVLSLNFWVNTGKKRYIAYIVTFITIIVLTVSRSGILGVCSALFIYTICTVKINKRKLEISKKTIRAFFIMITTIIIFVFLMFCTNVRVFKRILGTAEDQSTYARFEDWLKVINIFGSKEGAESSNISVIEKEDDKNLSIQDNIEDKEEQLNIIIEDNNKEEQANIVIENNNQEEQNKTEENKKSKNNILLGIGYNMLGFTESNSNKPSSSSFGNDSSLLVIFISSGIIGTIYMAYVISDWFIRTYKLREKSENKVSLITIIITSLIICNFNNLLFYTLWVLPMFILLNLENKN